jgi:hypothetical protein
MKATQNRVTGNRAHLFDELARSSNFDPAKLAGAVARQQAKAKQPPTLAERMADGSGEPSYDVSIGECNPLGSIRGREWVSGPARLGLDASEFEMMPEQALDPDWPNARMPGVWIVRADGWYVPTRQHAVGEFASRTTPKVTKARPGRWIPPDDLADLRILARRAASAWGHAPSRAPSAENILAGALARGVRVVLGPDDRLLLLTDRGRPADPVAREAIGAAAPLIVAHLHGDQVRCGWAHGKDPAPLAVTVSGGVPICSIAAHEMAEKPAGVVDRLKAAVGL